MDKPVRRNIVVSGVNLRKGGTLTVLQDCLQYLSARKDLQVTAIVHKRALNDYPGIDYIEIPWSAKGWLRRLWCEYVTLHKISKRLPDTDLWLSLHDTSPRVKAKRQAVYCHTPFPFMKARFRDLFLNHKIALFSLFTQFAYRWNVRSNRYLIVQQTWMREAMAQLLHFDQKRIIVAPPAFTPMGIPAVDPMTPPVFIFPSFPDVHKDFETLCAAARILEGRVGKGRFKVLITVGGEENRYARWLKKHWGDVSSLDFHGLLKREELAVAYGEAACLVFPSRAETWGLPISEFKPTGRPMILADLPYAHETAAGASRVAYFSMCDPTALATAMEDFLNGKMQAFQAVPVPAIDPPKATDWHALFDLLLDDNQKVTI